MQSTLKPKPADDPHDVLEVAPGVVLVAPADAEEELSNLLRAAARQHADPQVREEPNFSAAAPVPAVDTTFRATAVDKVRLPSDRPSMGTRALRGFLGFLLAIGIGVAAAAWQAYGDTAKQMIANLVPQLLPLSSPPLQTTGLPDQPASTGVPASTAVQAAPAETAVQGAAPAAAAPSPAEAPSLQSMARDLAAAGQQIEQLKASIEQLKASQEQMSRDIAKASEIKASEPKASEPSPRPRLSALPPRPAAVPARKPAPSFRPSQAAAPYVPPPPAAAPYVPPQAAAPYVPRQAEPLPPPAAAQPPPADPELASVPRPPMPLPLPMRE